MNILTFDIEEWFHILDNESIKSEKEWSNYEYRLDANMDRIFELLERENQKATFFCLGWIARKFPHIIKRIDELGYEIASHSDKHQLAYEQSKEDFGKDLQYSINSIEDLTGKKIRTYRAPGFSIKEENKWVFEVLLENGIEIDCSVFPAKRSHGGFENYGYAQPSIIECDGIQLKEFPINLFKVANHNIIFSGGGYFRLFPYWIIKRMMNRSEYVMTYFHPRDFDPKQPIIEELSRVRLFKSYVGLSSALKKLNHLISEFEFIDIATANASVDWKSAKKIVT